jgi:hypothetical protein
MKHKPSKLKQKLPGFKRGDKTPKPLHPRKSLAGGKRFKRPQIPHAIRKRLPGRKTAMTPAEAISNLPRITNETVAEHREEVLSSARKYIYPLQHSRDRIIKISIVLFVAAIIAFFAYCTLALYKFNSTSAFIYEVTRVIPFPVAKAGKAYVSYENYLFELRHLMHYYQTQQKENFNDPKTAGHLTKLRQDSLQKVIDDAYVKQLAEKNKITVSNREVDDQIGLVKSQNRLGSNDQMLKDVLNQFWGWSVDDFRRELKTQLLRQKVASSLDVTAHAKANNALAELNAGTDFGAVAGKYSEDDATKSKGGQYPGTVGKTSRDVAPQVVDALFKLQPGQVSQIIDTGYSLEIVKNISISGDKVQGAHIMFRLEPVSKYLKPLQEEGGMQHFIQV